MKAIWIHQKLKRVSRTLQYIPDGFIKTPVEIIKIFEQATIVGTCKYACVRIISSIGGFPIGHIITVPESEIVY